MLVRERIGLVYVSEWACYALTDRNRRTHGPCVPTSGVLKPGWGQRWESIFSAWSPQWAMNSARVRFQRR